MRPILAVIISLILQSETAVSLADRVLAAPTPAERDAILDANSSAITLEFERALIARARADERNFPKAVMEYSAAAAVAERLHAAVETGVSYRGLGLAHYRQGHVEQALNFYRLGVPSAETAGDKATLAELLRGIGLAENQLGHRDAAIAATEQSLALSRELGDLQSVSGMLNNLSVIYTDAGDWRRRIHFLQEALSVAETNHLDDRIRAAYDNLALAYFETGEWDVGLSYAEKTLQLKEAAHVPGWDLSTTLINIGDAYRHIGRTDKALEADTRALALDRASGDERRTAEVLINLGALHSAQGAYPLARSELEEAKTIHDKNQSEDGRAKARFNLANLALKTGNPDAARSAAQEAVDISRAAGLQTTLMYALPALGDALLATGRRTEARQVFTEAVNVVETKRRNLGGGGTEGSEFLEQAISPYHALVQIAVEDGRTADALAMAEQAKARQLFDLIHTNRVEITRAMTTEERAEEQRIGTEVTRLNAALTMSASATETAGLRAQFENAIGRLDAFRASLYRTHPELQLQRGDVQPLSKSDLASLVSDKSTAFVEYVVADKATFAFVITRTNAGDANIVTTRIPINRTALEHDVEAFRRQLAARDFTYRESARALYRTLIRPVEASLRGKTLLGIVPDGVLWTLPFHALVDPSGAHVIEQHAVFYAPSLTTLAETTKIKRTRADRPTLLATSAPSAAAMPVELPPLAEVEAETGQLAGIYGRDVSTILKQTDATEARWKAEAGRYRVLHLATHGVLNSVNPLYSYLVLGKGSGEDGLLEAREILDMMLNADLAVLSACDTARGQFHYGEGTIGLTWAFLVAGTPTTVVSDWSVDAASTSQLMLELHRQLLSSGGGSLRGKARAMQRASIAMMRQPSTFRHPFYWAGFAVVGDGF